MISNVVLNSPDRILYDTQIRQETKTGFLNLSDLQEAYTRARVINGWSDKRIDHKLNYQENIYRIYYILTERKIINVCLDTFIENSKTGFLKYLKKLGVYKTTGARHTKTTWCEPYIWILLSMELSPAIYGKVVVWLGDKLILNRIEAGNFYKSLSKNIAKFGTDVDYRKLAKSLNYKIFGKHETGMRNFATKEQLQKLYELELNISFAIDMGYINSFEDAIKTIDRAELNK
jgi:hypothetical protein